MEQSTSLEQTKKLAFQQHSIYEQEIHSLDQQVETLKKVHTSTHPGLHIFLFGSDFDFASE